MGLLDWFFRRKIKKMHLNIAEKPKIQLPDEIAANGFNALWTRLYHNLAPPLGRHSDIWARPAPRFPGAYLWDSSFISQAWKIWDPTIGYRILKPFVEFQVKNGRLPHNIFWGRTVGSLSNPPFLAWAVKSLMDYYPDEQYSKFFLDPLISFTKWRKEHRFNQNFELYYWEHSYESGIDNTPRFTSRDESIDYGTKDLGAIDLNSEIVLQHDSLLKIMEYFSRSKDYQEVNDSMEKLNTNIEKSLWDPNEKLFGDLDFKHDELKSIDTIASYFPLSLPVLSKEKEEYLLKNLKNPEKYNTLIPTPTVAIDSPDFVKDMWRGPVWINTSYLIVKGLNRKGYNQLASDFAYRLCKGVYETWKNEGYFFEFYDPERYDLKELSRKKGNLFKKITLGSKPVKKFAGWTADINTLLIENVIGLFREEEKWKLEPHLPEDWIRKGGTIDLRLPFYAIQLNIEIQKDQEYFDVNLILKEKKHSFGLKNHEIISFS